MFSGQSVGIDFQEHEIIIAALKLYKGQPIITQLKRCPLQDEWLPMQHENDTLHLVQEIKKALQPGMRRKLKHKKAHLSIPTQHILLRKISTLPDLPEKDLTGLIAFEIGENIHLPFDDPVYDFVKMEKVSPLASGRRNIAEQGLLEVAATQEGDVQTNSEVVLFSTSERISRSLSNVVRKLGLKPVSAEIRALSLLRLIQYLHPHWMEETDIVVDIGQDSCDIHIFQNNMVIFTRNIFMEKESYLVHQEINPQQYAQNIYAELEKALNFYRYTLNERNKEIKQLILVGEYAASLPMTLEELAGYPVIELDYRSFQQDLFGEETFISSAGVALGLALRGFSKI